ncbi:MAG: site-specific integrase [Rhodothermales bacterium]
MATVTPLLRTAKKDKKGRSPIWLRIADRNGSRFLSLGEKVRPSQWNPRTGRVRKSHPHADLLNKLIDERVHEAEAEVLRLKIDGTYATADHVKKHLTVDPSADFFEFAERYLDALAQRGKIARVRRLRATLGKLRTFLAPTDLSFERLEREGYRLLSGFEAHCLTSLGNKQSSVATNLKDIRTLINLAEREDLIDSSRNPYRKFTIKEGRAPERTKLTFSEIKRIEALDLDEGTPIWHVRNYFLFAFYSAGVRFGDIAEMTQGRILLSEDEQVPDRLVYFAGKTGKRHSIAITPPALEILSHYLREGAASDAFVFPMLEGYDLSTPKKLHNAKASRNTLANKHLKQIAKLAAIDKKVTFHIARHSFADAMRSEEGWSVYEISKALGHSSITQTERYLKSFDDEALDKRMRAAFQPKGEA